MRVRAAYVVPAITSLFVFAAVSAERSMKRLLIVTLFLPVYCLGNLEANGGEEIMGKVHIIIATRAFAV